MLCIRYIFGAFEWLCSWWVDITNVYKRHACICCSDDQKIEHRTLWILEYDLDEFCGLVQLWYTAYILPTKHMLCYSCVKLPLSYVVAYSMSGWNSADFGVVDSSISRILFCIQILWQLVIYQDCVCFFSFITSNKNSC